MWTTDRNGVVRRSEALDAGRTDADIRQAVRRGELLVACRGLYIPSCSLPVEKWRLDQEVYRRRCLSEADAGAVLSHQSAAAILGLAMLEPDTSRVHVSVQTSANGKRRATRHIHTGLDENDVIVVDGILVTSLARSAVDVALTSDFAGALAVFDSALRMGVDRAELHDRLESGRRRGIARARVALRYANGLAANPGESWSRAQMIEAHLPVPRLQSEITVEGRTYFSDFDWDLLVIGEFDGQGKYLANLRPGEKVADAVLREKDRENALRRIGFEIVRWDWTVAKRRQVAARVRPYLDAAGLL
ncbi:type IV toxin-antitoxin system AbiEi family antitoxin domain-containing protein [Gordonia malaquae]|uniref:type IV toxin-antitoxin system AbiEi family antitoxin domain-containing protein n=1 Tax=Gordonia malaquae TaxID=410332 RepID=UPI0030FE17CD